MKIEPLITIGITCFNASSTIERALRSGLSQDWTNIELLVVDDGSTDGSRDILLQWVNYDNRVRVIEHQGNQGCSAARNTLIRHARGIFLAFFDDDDISRSDRVRLQYERLVTYEQRVGSRLVACYASGNRLYPNGYVVPIRAVGMLRRPPVGNEMADYLLFYKRCRGVFYGSGTPTCSLMARTCVFRAMNGFDTAMRRQEDADFAVRLAFAGGHFIGITEPVLTQYVTCGSEKSARVEFESFVYLIDKNALYLRRQSWYRFTRLWGEMRYHHFDGHNGRAILVLIHLLMLHPVRTSFRLAVTGAARVIHERRMRARGHLGRL